MQACCSHASTPCQGPGVPCRSGLPPREAWAEVRALSKTLPGGSELGPASVGFPLRSLLPQELPVPPAPRRAGLPWAQVVGPAGVAALPALGCCTAALGARASRAPQSSGSRGLQPSMDHGFGPLVLTGAPQPRCQCFLCPPGPAPLGRNQQQPWPWETAAFPNPGAAGGASHALLCLQGAGD